MTHYQKYESSNLLFGGKKCKCCILVIKGFFLKHSIKLHDTIHDSSKLSGAERLLICEKGDGLICDVGD